MARGVVDLDDGEVVDLDDGKPTGAELRKLRKQKRDEEEAKRLARLAARVQSRREDLVVVCETTNGGGGTKESDIVDQAKANEELRSENEGTKEVDAAKETEEKLAQEALSKEQQAEQAKEAAAAAVAAAESAKKAEGEKAMRKRKRKKAKQTMAGSKVLKWEVRSTALLQKNTGKPSLPQPLAALAAANAALAELHEAGSSSDSSHSSTRATGGGGGAKGRRDRGIRMAEAACDSDGSSSLSELSSQTCSPSSHSSASTSDVNEAMAIAKELAEGPSVASFAFERPFKMQSVADFNAKPLLPAGGSVGLTLGRGAQAASPEVETFLLASQVDADSAARLRALPPLLQQRIMARGAIMGSRNPSSVLSARIREAEMGTLAPPTGTGSGSGITPQMLMKCNDPEVEGVIEKFQLDMRAAGLIRSLPHDQRRKILDMPLKDVRNPSAFITMQLQNGGQLSATTAFGSPDPSQNVVFGKGLLYGIQKVDGIL